MRRILLLAVVVTVLASGCGSASTGSASPGSASTGSSPSAMLACASAPKPTQQAAQTAASSPAGRPAYARPGHYAVGYTTLHLPDRDVAVWYPVDVTAVAGMTKVSYDQAEPLPANLRGILPPKYDTVTTMDAYADVRASAKGPFPVLLFSHGAGGYRLVHSALDAGIASWGFVVVSVDYLEHGLAAQVKQLGKKQTQLSAQAYHQMAVDDRRLMLAGLDLVTREGHRAGSPLQGAVDATRVAAAGHSVGGGTALDALTDPRVKVAVAWAPVPPSGAIADKPVMIIGACGDSALTPTALGEDLRGVQGAEALRRGRVGRRPGTTPSPTSAW